MSVFIAYQNTTIDGVQVEQASFVADTRETFQPPMYGLRSDYQDLFDYEAALAELTTQKQSAEATLDKATIAVAEAERFKAQDALFSITAALEVAKKYEERDEAKIAELTVLEAEAKDTLVTIEAQLVELRAPVTEIEAQIAALIKPDKVLPFVLLDRIVEHDGRAELVNGQVLFDDEIDVARASEIMAIAKSERATAVASITVEVDGMTFDGDEKAQERMARTVTAATTTGASMDDTTTWVLHDNTVAQVTVRQLATALRLAGEAQTALWTVPYEASYTPDEAA